ncbi:MAG: preprotein translocase subunit SecG [Pseudomonadales bacterium]
MGVEQIVLIVHVMAAIGIVALILIQQGKGADAGASFGSGASQTVFGSGGSGNFLTKSTAMLATLFFATSFALAIYAKDKANIDVDTGLPSAEAIEAQAEQAVESIVDDEVPVLDASDIPSSLTDDMPADSDIPE